VRASAETLAPHEEADRCRREAADAARGGEERGPAKPPGGDLRIPTVSVGLAVASKLSVREVAATSGLERRAAAFRQISAKFAEMN